MDPRKFSRGTESFPFLSLLFLPPSKWFKDMIGFKAVVDEEKETEDRKNHRICQDRKMLPL